MGPEADAPRLRRALRDLVALSTVPAVWVGREPPAIAAGLADVLVNSLHLDFAFVRLCDPNGGTAVEIARGSAWHLVAGFPFGAKDVERVVKLRTIEFRFAADSPLEERRFEPSVPP